MLRYTLLPLLLLVYSATSQASSTYRCNSKLVSLQADSHEVRNKCGAPVDQVQLGYKLVTNEYGHRNEVRLEEWTYGPKNGMYHFLRFEGGRLVRITSSR